MKKIIGIMAVAAMVATSAFAEITVGAWGRAGINFINKGNTNPHYTVSKGTAADDTNTGTDATVKATPDGWNDRVGVKFAGVNADKTIGFNLNVDSTANAVSIGDQAKIWGKIGFLTVQFGKIQLDDLRGSVGDWGDRDIGSKGEDDIFDRFYPKAGMTVELRPIDGMFIGAVIDTTTSTKATTGTYSINAETGKIELSSGGKTTTTWGRIDDTFKAINVGAGYTVKDVMQIKAAYFGSAETHNGGKLEFGVDLLGIKNNTIEIGAKLPLYDNDTNRLAATADYFDLTVGISGGKDKLTYKGHVFSNFACTGKVYDNAKSDKFATTPTIGLDCGVEYDIGVCSIGGTAKYNVQFYNESATLSGVSYATDSAVNTLGAELYAKKGFSNGYLFAGVADKVTITNTKKTIGSDWY